MHSDFQSVYSERQIEVVVTKGFLSYFTTLQTLQSRSFGTTLQLKIFIKIKAKLANQFLYFCRALNKN